jgi:hypothetical protein
MMHKVIKVRMAPVASQMRENSLIHGQIGLYSAAYLHFQDRVHLSSGRISLHTSTRRKHFSSSGKPHLAIA